MAVLVSACLLGETCKWDGGTNFSPEVAALLREREVIPVCPEVAGGLPVPRLPAELRDGEVIRRDGVSVDRAFRDGAAACLALCGGRRIDCAILKGRSPSCGSGAVYDGSFTGTLVPGDGVFAALLKANGIPVFTEEEWEEAAHALADRV